MDTFEEHGEAAASEQNVIENPYRIYREHRRALQDVRDQYHLELVKRLKVQDQHHQSGFISDLHELQRLPDEMSEGAFYQWWDKLTLQEQASQLSRYKNFMEDRQERLRKIREILEGGSELVTDRGTR